VIKEDEKSEGRMTASGKHMNGEGTINKRKWLAAEDSTNLWNQNIRG